MSANDYDNCYNKRNYKNGSSGYRNLSQSVNLEKAAPKKIVSKKGGRVDREETTIESAFLPEEEGGGPLLMMGASSSSTSRMISSTEMMVQEQSIPEVEIIQDYLYWQPEAEEENEEEEEEDEEPCENGEVVGSSEGSEDDNNEDILPDEDEDIEPVVENDLLVDFEVDESLFNVNEIISQKMEEFGQFTYPADDQKRIHEFTDMTKGNLVRKLRHLLNKHKVSYNAEEDFMNLIRDSVGMPPQQQDGVDLPGATYRSSNSMEEEDINGNNNERADGERLQDERNTNKKKTKTENYIPPTWLMLDFDVCKNADCVFVGQYANHFNCYKCGTLRYQPCKNAKCKGVDENTMCQHRKGRTPWKKVYYRPILPVITQLLQSEGFLHALNYVNHDSYTKADVNDMYDMMDSEVPVRTLHSMNDHFTAFLASIRLRYAEFNENEVNHVPLLLRLYYDGAQVHKSIFSNFWPLFFGIMNLPPTYRPKLTKGIFMNALFTLEKNSAAEKFLFENCLIAELQHLERGILTRMNNNSYYFIHARMISHILDSPALAKHIKASVVGSSGCCLCGQIFGIKRPVISRMVIAGHRLFLPNTNFTRYRGQSLNCCPAHFYTKYKKNGVYLPPATSVDDLCPQSMKDVIDVNNLSFCDDTNAVFTRSLVQTLRYGEPLLTTFENDKEFIEDPFINNSEESYLYYPHMDFRQPEALQRRTNQFFVENAAKAKLDAAKTNGGKKTTSVKGVHDLFPFAKRLSYVRMDEDFSFDPFHALKGYCSKSLNLLRGGPNFGGPGNRNTSKVRRHCHGLRSHPSLYSLNVKLSGSAEDNNEFKSKPVYEFQPSTSYRVDAWVNALHVPKGYSQDFQVQFPFQRMGMLRGVSIIQCCYVLMDFILLAVPINDLPKAYRNYLSMMSGNICRLMRHNFNRQEILYDLHPKIMEQISMHEGVFPESEMAPTIHQVIHIASYILKMGAPKEWWNLPCERAIGQIKQFVPKGGTSIEITVFNKYLRFEMSSMFENYSLSKMGHDDDSCAFIAPTTDDGSRKPLLVCTDRMVKLKHILKKTTCGLSSNWNITRFELAQLLDGLLSSVEFRTEDNVEVALKKSSLYRLFHFYRNYFTVAQQSTPISILQWNEEVPRSKDIEEILKDLLWKDQPGEGSNFVSFLFAVYSWIKVSSMQEGLILLKAKQGVTHSQVESLFSVANTTNADLHHKLVRSDINTLYAICEGKLKVEFYSMAIVYGTTFRSRGFECRESAFHADSVTYGAQNKAAVSPHNPVNILKHNWSVHKELSSWCKLRVLRNKNKSLLVGQINVFFRLNFPDDNFLHNSSFASITCRHVLPNKNSHCTIPRSVPLGEVHINVVAASDDQISFNYKVSFVDILTFVPTPLLVCGLDQSSPQWNAYHEACSKNRFPDKRRPGTINELVKDAKPYYLYHGTIRKSFAESNAKVQHLYSSQPRVNISALILVDLYRNKNHYEYNNINDQWYKSWLSAEVAQKRNIKSRQHNTDAYHTNVVHLPFANLLSTLFRRKKQHVI